ncbi:hypothetical protein BT93_H1554 [Corymbia citriodora subsp. variegata]|nr:hypothetical protein BT93_H1554 [Corymbia citriodora subsp. variegata]
MYTASALEIGRENKYFCSSPVLGRGQAQLGRYLFLHEWGGGVYWNGALHWCVIDASKEKMESVIMSFDLLEDKFQQVLQVPEVHRDIRFKGLGIHGSNLFIYLPHCCCNYAFTLFPLPLTHHAHRLTITLQMKERR